MCVSRCSAHTDLVRCEFRSSMELSVLVCLVVDHTLSKHQLSQRILSRVFIVLVICYFYLYLYLLGGWPVTTSGQGINYHIIFKRIGSRVYILFAFSFVLLTWFLNASIIMKDWIRNIWSGAFVFDFAYVFTLCSGRWPFNALHQVSRAEGAFSHLFLLLKIYCWSINMKSCGHI